MSSESSDAATSGRDRASAVTLRWLTYGAVLLGIALRLRQLLADRGLSQDEATLTLNLMHRSLSGLFGQLDYQQAAPEGFLLLQKLLISGLGSAEWVLRLLPFVAGVAALVLIVPLARAAVTSWAVPLAAALLAISDPLINWTVYDKQYAVDVLVAEVVLLGGLRLMSVRPRRFAAVTFALAAAVVIWLSHPSVFVLGAVSFALVFRELVNRNWANALAAVVASLPWLASFGIFVLTASNNLVLLQTALRGSPGAFAGAGGSGLEPLRRGLGEFRYVTGVPHFLRHGNVDAGLVVLALVAALCIVGTVALASRSYEKALLLVLPLALMLIGWGVGKYPLLGRTQLFLLPSFSLLLAEGIVRIVQRPRRAPLQLASAALAAGVVIAVAAPAAGHLLRPATLEDVRPVLDYVAHSQRRTDTIYVYYAAEYQLRYYLECGCAGRAFKEAVKSGLWPLRPALGGPAPFAPALRSRQPRFQVSVFRGEDAAEYVADIAALRGRGRVWFLLSAVDATNRALLLRTFDRYGVRQSAFSVGEGENVAAAYLYDMRPVRKTRAP